MTEQTAIVQHQMDEWSLMERKAQMLIASRFLPEAIDTPAKAIAIMLYGQELNIPDWTALKHINVIQGAPQADGQLTLALINRSGLLERFVIKQSDTQACTVIMKRRGQPEFEATCTIKEVSGLVYYDKDKKPHPLTEKYNWKQQPKTMLFWFTVKQIGRRLFSDVLNGMAGRKDGDLVVQDDVYVTDEALHDVTGAQDAPKPEGTTARIVTGNPTNGAESAGSDDQMKRYDIEGKLVDFEPEPPEWKSLFDQWIKANFYMKPKQIGDALKRVPQWADSKDIAKAAIILAECAYDRALLDGWFEKHTGEEWASVREAALNILDAEAVDGEVVEE